MSKQIVLLVRALDALEDNHEHHLVFGDENYRNSMTYLTNMSVIESLKEALEESDEAPLTVSQEERLQKVEQGLAALGWVHKSGGSNPVDFPKFGGCPQQGNLDKADRCATCTCWKSNDIVAVGRLTVALNSNS